MFLFYKSLFLKTLLALFFSFFISLYFSNYYLAFCKRYKIYQPIRKDINLDHCRKNNTPTMGGIIIIISIFLTSLLFLDWSNYYVILLFYVLFSNFLIGSLDDFLKVFFENSCGLSILNKYILQSFFSFIFIYLYYGNNIFLNIIKLPFFNKYINLGYLNFLLQYFVLVGSSNSVNITDGLDGLVIFPLILVSLFLFIISYISSNIYLSKIFNFTYLFYSEDLVILSVILLGSLLGFFWFNFYPAKIFMGDIGSLSLGSLIGAMFILLHKEFYLLIVGFIFVIEILSVMLQVFYFKFYKKRIFLMSPLHHHYELKGFNELEVVSFFWIISLISFFLSLLFLIGLIY